MKQNNNFCSFDNNGFENTGNKFQHAFRGYAKLCFSEKLQTYAQPRHQLRMFMLSFPTDLFKQTLLWLRLQEGPRRTDARADQE